METSETEYEQNGNRERTAANGKREKQQQTISLLDFETLQKTKISLIGEQSRPQRPVAARNDVNVTAKKVVSGLFQNL